MKCGWYHESERRAVIYCENCKRHLCRTCSDSHNRHKYTKPHSTIPLRQTQWKRKSFLDLKVEYFYPISINFPKQKFFSMFSGCVFTNDGELILCDKANGTVILLGYSFQFKEILDLKTMPWSVATVDQNTALITLPKARTLQFLELTPKLKKAREIQLDSKCWCVAVANHTIYLTCHSGFGHRDGEVNVLDIKGNLQQRLDLNQINTWSIWFKGLFGFKQAEWKMCDSQDYISVNESTEKIFVSGSGRMVVCYKFDGSVVYKSLLKTKSLLTGICVDHEDNVIICDSLSNTVGCITADGTSHNMLLTAKDACDIFNKDSLYVLYGDDPTTAECVTADSCVRRATPLTDKGGFQNPQSVAFRQTDNVLVITCCSGAILVYHLE